MLSIIFVVIAFTSVLVTSHSWLECTDYRVKSDDDTRVWNPSICFGRARNSARQNRANFGDDTGMNHEGRTCQSSYVANEPDVPRASYVPGQKVCLAYPAKNHASSKENQYIPDMGVVIRRSKVGDLASDKFDGHTYEHMNGNHVFGQVDYKGFQNCPEFGKSGTDKVLCTLCFNLEPDLAPGEYAFSWEWNFQANQFYTTCWDAIVGTGETKSSSPTIKPLPPSRSNNQPPSPSTLPSPSSNDPQGSTEEVCQAAQNIVKLMC